MGAIGRKWCNKLFKIERERAFPEERLSVRRRRNRQVFEAYYAWIKIISAKITTNEKLTKAITYILNPRKYLEPFLTDGRIPLSNNWNESKLRNYAVAQREWLFADSTKGEESNGTAYTLIETEKMNHLNVYKYIKFLLEMMPNTDYLKNPKLLDAYLPWSNRLPEKCRIKELYK